MSIIVRNLLDNIVSQGYGLAPGEEPVTGVFKVNFEIENNVKTEEEYYPTTGVYSNVSGWKWNKTFARNLTNIKERINTKVGGYEYNVEEGSMYKDWKGASINGLDFSNIIERKRHSRRLSWIPKINVGSYSIYHYRKPLFPRRSFSKILKEKETIINEVNVLGEVFVACYKRDNKFNNFPYEIWEQVEEEGKEKSFYITENNKIVLNKEKAFKIGEQTNTDIQHIKNMYEYLGVFQNNRNISYTEFFPCSNLTLKSLDSFGNVFEWTRIYKESDFNNFHNAFILNESTGKIVFGYDFEETNYVLKDEGSKIEFFNEISNKVKPGMVLEENIIIKEVGKYEIYLEEREASFEKGKKVTISTNRNNETAVLKELYASYDVYPRVDIKVEGNEFWDNDLDLKPFTKQSSNGMLCLSSTEKHLSSITLSTDLPLISGKVYGPLYVRSGIAELEALCKNGNDEIVKEIEVTFKSEGNIFENKSRNEITKYSQDNGIAYSNISVDIEEDKFSTFVRQVEHLDGNTIINLPDIGRGAISSDIVLFQVLKTDPFYGSLGYKANVIDSKKYIKDGKTFFDVFLDKEIPDPEDYETYQTVNIDSKRIFAEEIGRSRPSERDVWYENFGMAYAYYLNGIASQKFLIQSIEKNKVTLRANNDATPGFLMTSLTLFKKEEVNFNDSQEGVERLVYEYSETEEKYIPLRPTSIRNNRLVYSNIELPDPNIRNSIVSGYKIYYPKESRVICTATDPATGREVTSNELVLKIELPEYLKDPNGFVLSEDESNTGSGLNAANFLTINPKIKNQINFFV